MKFINLYALCFLLVHLNAKLVFEDNFDFLDFQKWHHHQTWSDGSFNGEFQLYLNSRKTTYTKNGILNIQPVLTDAKTQQQYSKKLNDNFYPIMSGRINTAQSFKFLYGRVEVRAKLPKGDWLWPAIWCYPKYEEYGGWPASGEIDIMESRGNIGYPKQFGGGPETSGSTLHWGPDYTQNQYEKTHVQKSISSGTYADDFHTYGLYWDDKILYTYIDNDTNRALFVDHSNQSYWQRSGLTNSSFNPWQYSKNKNAPFDRPFYLILNLAVGGTNGYFPDGVASKPWSNNSPRAAQEFYYDNKGQWWPTWSDKSSFQIDSVKVWDLTGTSASKTNVQDSRSTLSKDERMVQ